MREKVADEERRGNPNFTHFHAEANELETLEAVFEEKVDPDILGGLIIRIQDWIYDASVRTRLGEVREQLVERSSHGIQGGRNRFGD